MPQLPSSAMGKQFRSKSSWAYETIRSMIVSGDLAAGAKLDQQALAGRLGISTTPLREALRRLEAEDYVESEDHKEMRVTPLSLDDIQNLLEVRLQLEPFAVKRACERITPAEIRAVRSLLPSDGAVSNVEQSIQIRAFHRAIWAPTGNAVLTRMLEGLWDQCDRYRVVLLGDAAIASNARREYLQMCELLEAGDSLGLQGLVHEHLTGSLERCRQVASISPAPEGAGPDASGSGGNGTGSGKVAASR